MEAKKNGIYNVHGIKNTNTAKIIPVGMVDLEGNNFIPDKLLATKKIFDDIIGSVYYCNILDKILMTTKKLPVLYIDISINKKINRVHLFKLCLYFTITEDINSADQLIDNQIEGKFSIESIVDNCNDHLEDLEKFKSIESSINYLSTILDTEGMNEFIRSLVNKEIQKTIDKYGQIYNDEIPQATYSFVK